MIDPFRAAPNARAFDGPADRSGSSVGARRGRSQASQLVALATHVELFHTPEGEPFATFEVGNHRETALISGHPFRQYLACRYYNNTGSTPNAQAMQEAIGILAGQATFGGEMHSVHVRLAELEGAIYLDLGNGEWEVVKIAPTGWEIVTIPR